MEIIQQTKESHTEAIDKGGTSISDYRRIDDKQAVSKLPAGLPKAVLSFGA